MHSAVAIIRHSATRPPARDLTAKARLNASQNLECNRNLGWLICVPACERARPVSTSDTHERAPPLPVCLPFMPARAFYAAVTVTRPRLLLTPAAGDSEFKGSTGQKLSCSARGCGEELRRASRPASTAALLCPLPMISSGFNLECGQRGRGPDDCDATTI